MHQNPKPVLKAQAIFPKDMTSLNNVKMQHDLSI